MQKNAFVIGLFWGWIPCGLVYSALGFAIISASVTQGVLIMLAFGLGTLPSLLLMATLSAQLTQFVQKAIVRKSSALLIILLGLLAIYNSGVFK